MLTEHPAQLSHFTDMQTESQVSKLLKVTDRSRAGPQLTPGLGTAGPESVQLHEAPKTCGTKSCIN